MSGPGRWSFEVRCFAGGHEVAPGMPLYITASDDGKPARYTLELPPWAEETSLKLPVTVELRYLPPES